MHQRLRSTRGSVAPGAASQLYLGIDSGNQVRRTRARSVEAQGPRGRQAQRSGHGPTPRSASVAGDGLSQGTRELRELTADAYEQLELVHTKISKADAELESLTAKTTVLLPVLLALRSKLIAALNRDPVKRKRLAALLNPSRPDSAADRGAYARQPTPQSVKQQQPQPPLPPPPSASLRSTAASSQASSVTTSRPSTALTASQVMGPPLSLDELHSSASQQPQLQQQQQRPLPSAGSAVSVALTGPTVMQPQRVSGGVSGSSMPAGGDPVSARSIVVDSSAGAAVTGASSGSSAPHFTPAVTSSASMSATAASTASLLSIATQAQMEVSIASPVRPAITTAAAAASSDTVTITNELRRQSLDPAASTPVLPSAATSPRQRTLGMGTSSFNSVPLPLDAFPPLNPFLSPAPLGSASLSLPQFPSPGASAAAAPATVAPTIYTLADAQARLSLSASAASQLIPASLYTSPTGALTVTASPASVSPSLLKLEHPARFRPRGSPFKLTPTGTGSHSPPNHLSSTPSGRSAIGAVGMFPPVSSPSLFAHSSAASSATAPTPSAAAAAAAAANTTNTLSSPTVSKSVGVAAASTAAPTALLVPARIGKYSHRSRSVSPHSVDSAGSRASRASATTLYQSSYRAQQLQQQGQQSAIVIPAPPPAPPTLASITPGVPLHDVAAATSITGTNNTFNSSYNNSNSVGSYNNSSPGATPRSAQLRATHSPSTTTTTAAAVSQHSHSHTTPASADSASAATATGVTTGAAAPPPLQVSHALDALKMLASRVQQQPPQPQPQSQQQQQHHPPGQHYYHHFDADSGSMRAASLSSRRPSAASVTFDVPPSSSRQPASIVSSASTSMQRSRRSGSVGAVASRGGSGGSVAVLKPYTGAAIGGPTTRAPALPVPTFRSLQQQPPVDQYTPPQPSDAATATATATTAAAASSSATPVFTRTTTTTPRLGSSSGGGSGVHVRWAASSRPALPKPPSLLPQQPPSRPARQQQQTLAHGGGDGTVMDGDSEWGDEGVHDYAAAAIPSATTTTTRRSKSTSMPGEEAPVVYQRDRSALPLAFFKAGDRATAVLSSAALAAQQAAEDAKRQQQALRNATVNGRLPSGDVCAFTGSSTGGVGGSGSGSNGVRLPAGLALARNNARANSNGGAGTQQTVAQQQQQKRRSRSVEPLDMPPPELLQQHSLARLDSPPRSPMAFMRSQLDMHAPFTFASGPPMLPEPAVSRLASPPSVGQGQRRQQQQRAVEGGAPWNANSATTARTRRGSMPSTTELLMPDMHGRWL